MILKKLMASLVSIPDKIVRGLLGFVSPIANLFFNILSDISSTVKTEIQKIASDISSTVKNEVQKIASDIGSKFTSVKNIASSIFSFFATDISSIVKTESQNIADDISSKVKSGVTNITAEVGTTLTNTIQNTAKGISETVMTEGEKITSDVGATLTKGLENTGNKIVSAFMGRAAKNIVSNTFSLLTTSFNKSPSKDIQTNNLPPVKESPDLSSSTSKTIESSNNNQTKNPGQAILEVAVTAPPSALSTPSSIPSAHNDNSSETENDNVSSSFSI